MKRSFLTILLSKARSSHEVTYVMDDFIIADESMIWTHHERMLNLRNNLNDQG